MNKCVHHKGDKWKCDTYFVIKSSQNGNGLKIRYVCKINGLFFWPYIHYCITITSSIVYCEQKVFPNPANFDCRSPNTS